MSVPPLPGKAIKGVYRGYMPIGLPQHAPPNRIKPWMKIKGKPRYTWEPKPDVEPFTEFAQYPPVHDRPRKGTVPEIRYNWYDMLKKSPTVETKMFEMLKHGQHYLAHTPNFIARYNSLPLVQYLTHTRIVNKLPQNNDGESFSQETINEVKDIVLDQIAVDRYQSQKFYPFFVTKTHRFQIARTRDEDQIVQNIYNRVKKRLALETNAQLLDYQHDWDPAINSWWYHSGFEPPNNKVFYRSRKDADGCINQIIQMTGAASLNLRSTSFLRPQVSLDDPLVTEPNVIDRCSYPLKDYGFVFKFGNPVALAGHWFPEHSKSYDSLGYDFAHTCLLSTQCLKLREHKKYKLVKQLSDREEGLLSQAILTGFGWMNSLSMYHGFTPFDEVEYPFTCQVISTDGKNWLFNIYQMNSHTFHRDLGGPQRNNICWSSGLMQLYEDFDGSKFSGVNDQVIKLLVRLLSQQTDSAYTKALNLMPLLSEDERDEETVESQSKVLIRSLEQRKNRYLLHDWKVPLWEHIFFRSKVMRYRIREIKPRYHIPKPLYPKHFE